MMTTINGEHLCVSLVPLFNQLSLPDQKRIETMVHHHHYQRREIILSPGDEGKLLIVEAGRLKLYQLSESGDEQVLAVLGTGEYVGEQWLYGAANESTFAVVEQDAAICELTYDAFTNLLAEYPELAARLLQLTMAKVRELTAQNQFLVIDGVEERLWAYLSHLASQRGRALYPADEDEGFGRLPRDNARNSVAQVPPPARRREDYPPEPCSDH